MKTLVLYVFHIYNSNVQHFVDKCIFFDENVDFIVISNGEDSIKHIHNLPKYVKTLQRKNIGLDFGGWSDALLIDDLYNNYDAFIFVNSTVVGPFDIKNNKWTDVYTDPLNERVRLFGSTINTINKPLTHAHVQSYIFSMYKNTLEYLINCEIFSMTNYALSHYDAVNKKEILMSRKVIEKGWNIQSLLKIYKDVDFTFKTKTPKQYKIIFLGDIMYKKFRNKLWTDNELVFIKKNRCT
jgi:lipopolysaccharide biosynthesis protein